MITIGELRTEAQRLRDLQKGIIDPDIRAELRELIAELEGRARAMETGSNHQFLRPLSLRSCGRERGFRDLIGGRSPTL